MRETENKLTPLLLCAFVVLYAMFHIFPPNRFELGTASKSDVPILLDKQTGAMWMWGVDHWKLVAPPPQKL